MAVNMRKQARPDAAKDIAEDLYELAALKGKAGVVLGWLSAKS